MEEKQTLYKKANWFRPLHFKKDFKSYEIGGFIFYHKGKIIKEIERGFFEDEQSRSDITSLEINTLSRATKENLNRKDNYFLLKKRSWGINEKVYFVYINIDLEGLSFEELSLKDYINNEYEEEKKKLFLIKGVNATINKSYLDENEKLQYREAKTNEITLFNGLVTKKKDRLLELERIKGLIDEAIKDKFSIYDLQRIDKLYKISLDKR